MVKWQILWEKRKAETGTQSHLQGRIVLSASGDPSGATRHVHTMGTLGSVPGPPSSGPIFTFALIIHAWHLAFNHSAIIWFTSSVFIS